MKTATTKRILLISLCFFITSCFEKGELGSQKNPVKLYFTPSVDAETITTNSDDFLRFLESETGLFFETGVPASYISVVEAFGSERADIGVMNSFGYLMANEKYGAQAKLRVIRHGEDYYQGAIYVHQNTPIKTLTDLNHKKFAYTDPSSTSGYMFPKKILQDQGVRPAETTFAIKHDNVVTMVYQKQVDAGAAFYSAPDSAGRIRDARARVKTQFPDVESKVKILTITEKIPNDPFVFRKNLPAHVVEKFISAVKKYIATEKGKEVFENIYSVDGIVDATDADYEGLRSMIKALNIDISKQL